MRWQISDKVNMEMNKCLQIVVLMALFLPGGMDVAGQTATPATTPGQAPPPAARPQIDRKKMALADRPNLTLEDVNTVIAIDRRVIVMMAALNVAGYDYEPGSRALSVLRQQLRDDLKGVRPELVQKIRSYFQAHRKGATDAAAVAPYLSLALSMTDPPAFTIDVAADRLPDDVREITEFALILEEFYRETSFNRLLPKYVESYIKVAETYGPPAGLALGTVLTYLHTEPVLELPPLYVPRRTAPRKGAPVEEAITIPNRVRQFVIVPDLLNATGAANLRIVRDTYYLLLGPTIEPNVEAMRRAFLSFVIDPLTERQVREVSAIRGDLRKLMESRGERLDEEYAQRSAYFLLTDSLVRATDARMDVLGLAARRTSTEDEAIYELSIGYDRGAVLVYHFYEQIKAFEPVGVNIRDYFASLLKNVDFGREGSRLTEYATRLERVKKLRTEATLAPLPAPTIANADEKLVSQLVDADKLMKARSYESARLLLETALRQHPTNARVLFGLAEVASKQATSLDDADRVEEALFAAIEYYRQAVKNAAPESEKWLAQRSYVAAGRILDFISENNPSLADRLTGDALGAYEAALRLGRVEGGAYDEAEKALRERAARPK